MIRPHPLTAAGLSAALLLAACGRANDGPDPRTALDPVLTGAFADRIMTDPDLVSQNHGDAALAGGGVPTAEIPAEPRTREFLNAARVEAVRLAGGSIAPAPVPAGGASASPFAADPTPRAAVLALPGIDPSCASGLAYGATWAVKLPARVPIYPRGHLQDAAGSDAPGCGLRAVRFTTPLPAGEVTDFYFTIARAAKLGGVTRRQDGTDDVIAAGTGSTAMTAFVRSRDDGLTEVDLAATAF